MALADRKTSRLIWRPDQTVAKSGSWPKQVAAVIALFVSMQPFTNGPLGQTVRVAAFASAGFALLVVSLRPWRTIRMLKILHLRAVMFVPLASVLWSVNRGATQSALVSFIGATAIALLIIQELRADQAVAAVTYATISALMLSVAAEFHVEALRAGESFGVSGIFAHKNAIGRAAILLSMAALLGWSIRSRPRRWTTAGALGTSAVFGFWAGSGTAVLAVGIAVVAFAAMAGWQPGLFRDARIRHGTVLIVGAGILAMAIFVRPSEILESALAALGRDADNNTLFVRRSLWEATLNEISKRPILGFGYGTFDFQAVPVSTGLRTVVWEAQHPHNGVLDVTYQLGALGIGVYAHHLVRVWRSVLRTVRRQTLGPYLLLLGLASITYSVLYGTLAVFWIVHIIAVWAAIESSRRFQHDGVPG